MQTSWPCPPRSAGLDAEPAGWLSADPRWVETLMGIASALAKGKVETALPFDALRLLGATGDRRVTPLLIELLGHVELSEVLEPFEALLDPAAIEPLRAHLRKLELAAKKKQVARLIKKLERAKKG